MGIEILTTSNGITRPLQPTRQRRARLSGNVSSMKNGEQSNMTGCSLSPRKMVDVQAARTISQGSLFNFAYNESYDDCEILGLVITARCDISNTKIKKYSYLPVVPFCLWRERDLIPIIKRIKIKAIYNELQDSLNNAGFSRNTLSIYGPERLKEVASREITKKKTLDSLIKKISLYSLLKDSEKYDAIYPEFNKDIKSFVKDVIENKALEYYFIDDVPGYGACVVNLREVGHFDYVASNSIAKGIEFSDLSDIQKAHLRSINTSLGDGLACLVGLVSSPYIELIMQRFSELFTRIGVDDPEKELYVRVCEEGIE